MTSDLAAPLRTTLAALLFAASPAGLACTAEGDDDDSVPDGNYDEQGCLIAPSGGTAGVAGRQWLTTDWSTPEDDFPDYEILAWAPADMEGPLPVTMFVSRTLPANRTGILNILEDDIGLGRLAQEWGRIVAVPVAGPFESLNAGDDLGWDIGGEDDEFFRHSLDVLEQTFNVNRSRVHIFGSHGSAGWATWYAHLFADRVATTANHAGYNPFDPWPASWLRPVPIALLLDPLDPFWTREQMEETAVMFEAAGAPVLRHYDYDASTARTRHEFVGATAWPVLIPFEDQYCVDESWL